MLKKIYEWTETRMNNFYGNPFIKIFIFICAIAGAAVALQPAINAYGFWHAKAENLRDLSHRIHGRFSPEERAARKARFEKMEAEDIAEATRLCAMYPGEPICISWQAGQKCIKDEKCLEAIENNYSDEPLYPDACDVTTCFVDSKEVIDDDDDFPKLCRPLNIWMSLKEDDLKKVELSGNELAWSEKITPAHVAGIARGLKLILGQDKKLSDTFSDVTPYLDTIEVMGEGADKEMATGIMVGLYNSATADMKTAMEKYIQDTRAFCTGIKDKDKVPVRCRIEGDNALWYGTPIEKDSE